ncbi:hypothetical protein PSE_3693 [Pseudovibrio sp. FO-BEG1]|uniref:hypothetical protein n=1 Tax=Pseudovibrio sp. (strain FO-BEG1) TaxID=911045 RepID=UPI000238BE01|nr:hypothetical protein [Pseudovibrio sp. FO-BEG1]AEV38197.1 hypothetical protein PSE_3693 [Pseudovibrio sp. FO-BEG1]
MTGVSFSSTDHLSAVLDRIDHPANKDFVKDNAQVRIGGQRTDGAETIYQADTKDGNSKVSKASVAKLTGGKLFGNALQTHDKKLNNWPVFTQLAKNEISAGLQQGGVQNHQAKTDEVLSAAFERIQKNPTFHDNDVRFGALKELGTTINELVNEALSDAAYEEVSINPTGGRFIDRDGAVVLPNSIYGSAYSELPAGKEGATVRSEGEQSTPELGEQLYAEVNKGGGDTEGAPILRHYTPNQQRAAEANERKEAARVLADIDRQVAENENPYSRLNHDNGQLSEPGSFLLDPTYARLETGGTVNNEPLYANSEAESAVENSGDYPDVLLGDDQAIYGNLTEKGKPALMPKPALGDIPPVPPKRDASLR